MEFTPNGKLWLEKDGEKVFGDGPCDILQRIERTGSLRMAAAEINMSYSQAWKLINKLEKKLGFKLLEKKTGGKEGGGSTLTEQAKQLTMRYTFFRREINSAIESLHLKSFKEF